MSTFKTESGMNYSYEIGKDGKIHVYHTPWYGGRQKVSSYSPNNFETGLKSLEGDGDDYNNVLKWYQGIQKAPSTKTTPNFELKQMPDGTYEYISNGKLATTRYRLNPNDPTNLQRYHNTNGWINYVDEQNSEMGPNIIKQLREKQGIVDPVVSQESTVYQNTPIVDEQSQTVVDPRIRYNRGKRFTATNDVISNQQKLIDAGYNVGRKGADGYWGNDSEAAWNQYQTDLGYNNLTNRDLMSLTEDQLSGKAVTDATRERYRKLHEAKTANDQALTNSLTFNGKQYANADAYNAAVNEANSAQILADRNKYISDLTAYNNAKATEMALSGMPSWMNRKSDKARRYYEIAQNSLNYGDGNYADTLKGKDKRMYNRMMKRMPQESQITIPKPSALSTTPLHNTYTNPELTDLKLDATEFKKGGCVYKRGKRVRK